MTDLANAPDRLTVIYNGACPICAREIAHYRRRAAATGAPLAFADLARTDLAALGLTPEAAARRLHALEPGGRLLAGTPAFLALWGALPRWRWLARALALPGLRQLATLAYEGLAAPALYALHRRRVRRACPAPAAACRPEGPAGSAPCSPSSTSSTPPSSP